MKASRRATTQMAHPDSDNGSVGSDKKSIEEPMPKPVPKAAIIISRDNDGADDDGQSSGRPAFLADIANMAKKSRRKSAFT